MKMRGLSLALIIFVSACMPSLESQKSAGQLEAEVLQAAKICGAEIERDYIEAIERNKQRFTEEQLQNSLINMKMDIRC